MYMDDVSLAIQSLVDWVAPAGLLSVTFQWSAP